MVVIKKSDIHGRGVFATEDIPIGIILSCDILEVINNKSLNNYVFPFHGTSVCIHIGFATFLNSSINSNVKHIGIDIESKISYFEILCDIKEGDELTLNYLNP